MLTSASGRISSLEGLGALVLIREMNHADRRTLAARVVNSGGNPVTLVFNIGGFDNVYPRRRVHLLLGSVSRAPSPAVSALAGRSRCGRHRLLLGLAELPVTALS